VSDVAFGLFLLLVGLAMAGITVLQFRSREPAGETIFDLVAAIFPAVERPMFWASTAFLGLLAAVALVGAAIFFMSALGVS
jgi:hypothetical protein